MNAITLILSKIRSYHRKKFICIICAGFVNLIVYFSVIGIGAILTDATFYFSRQTRIGILFFIIGLILYLLYRSIISPIILYFHYHHDFTMVTREIGKKFPEINDKLTNIYQLITRESGNESNELKEYAIQIYAKEIKDIDFNSKIRLNSYLIPYKMFFLVLIPSIFLFFMMNGSMALAVKRIINPWIEHESTPGFMFKVNPGNVNIIAGNVLTVSVQYGGPKIRKCLFKYKFQNENSYQIIEMIKEKKQYLVKVEQLKKPIEYYIQGIPDMNAEWYEKIKSEKYDVNILYPPYLSDLKIKIYPPSYTGLPVQNLERNIGDVIAYKGSKIGIEATANKEINAAFIIFAGKEKFPLKIWYNKINANFRITKNLNYHFCIFDRDSVPNQAPIEYSITVLEDLPPLVEIIEPGKDIELAPDAVISLLIEGSDDFGFNDLNLNYQIIENLPVQSDSIWYKISIPIILSGNKYFRQYYTWSFSQLPVTFNDVIKYYVSLSDNNLVEGSRIARSSTYFIRFPSLNQIFTGFSDQQNENIKGLEEIIKQSKEIEDNIEKIDRELKKKNTLDWEEKKKIDAYLDKENKIQEKLEEIQDKLEESIQNLQNNQLLSTEILDKYNQLQELFLQVITPEIINAIEEVRKLIDKLNNENVHNKLEDFQINHKQLLERLERTLELYKKVKMEQELDRLVQTLKRITEEQKAISSQLKNDQKLNSDDLRRLEGRQKVQEKIFDRFTQTIDSLALNDLIKEPSDIHDLLKNSKEYIRQSNLKSKMKSLLVKLDLKDQNTASQYSDQLSEKFDTLYNQFKTFQQGMISAQKEKIKSKMIKTTEDLISLSNDQEAIMQDTHNLSSLSDQFREITVRQYQATEDMEQVIRELIDLSKETFFLPPELNISLMNVQNYMQESIKALEDRNQRKSEEYQNYAMAALNQSAILMENSMQQLSQSSSGLGFEQYLQQMQSMTGQQCQLNQESFSLFQGLGGKENLTIDEKSELKRLATEQKAIRQLLEQLDQDIGNRPDIIGRMNELIKEMDSVTHDMQEFKIDRKTIERQQKILSRMIDAQKSIREKEYSQQRLAEIGKEYKRKSPSEKMETVDKIEEKLNKALMKALQEGYNPDYEKLIENYFKRLHKSEVNDQ